MAGFKLQYLSVLACCVNARRSASIAELKGWVVVGRRGNPISLREAVIAQPTATIKGDEGITDGGGDQGADTNHGAATEGGTDHEDHRPRRGGETTVSKSGNTWRIETNHAKLYPYVER